jgi:class 3 adenylate cyclase
MRFGSTALATERVERKLAAILAADVAGYSRLMSVDEEKTHERLRAHLRDLIDPKIKEHRGRIVKSTGDGMLAEFSSVVDAVRCAAETQRAMIDRNADMPEDERISFRIGINLGDVIVERDDIFGDSVNIAARLQALAEPGGVCISPVVRDQIRGKLPYSFTDMGEQDLKNIPRPIRVYRLDAEPRATFVAPVTSEDAQQAPATPNGTSATNNLPVPLTRVVGRDDIIATLTVQLAQRRFLTILGPGGIGKTTVAIAIAEAASPSYRDGVWFVGLASLADPDLVPSAVSTVLRISLSGANPVSGLAAWLRDRQALIVLDNCEHVIGAVAALAETTLKAAPRVRILATSREPLRAEGESLHRLAALDLPSSSADLAADDALRYSAVQLFNERAMLAADGFNIDDANVAAVLEICRKLDGVPLATFRRKNSRPSPLV